MRVLKHIICLALALTLSAAPVCALAQDADSVSVGVPKVKERGPDEELAKYFELYNIADSLYHNGDIIGAMKPGLESAKVASRNHFEPEKIDSFRLLSRIYARLGFYNKCLVYSYRCYQFDSADGGNDECSESLTTMAKAYVGCGKMETAKRFINQALEIEEKVPGSKKIAGFYRVASDVYYRMGDYQTAYTMANNAFNADVANLGWDNAYVSKSLMAWALHNLGKDGQARKQAMESLAEMEAAGYQNGIPVTCFRIGCICSSIGDKENAQAYLERAIFMTTERQERPLCYEATVFLADMVKDSNPGYSADLYRKALEIKEEMGVEFTSYYEGRYNVEMEVAEKEQTIALQTELLQLQKRRNLYSIWIAILIFLAFVFYMFMTWRVRIMNRELVRLNNLKNSFFNVISHDLRSPAVAQQTVLKMVVENFDHLDIDQMRQICMDVSRLADSQVDLVENLLSWSRMQVRDSDKFHPVRFNVGAAVDEVMSIYQTVASQKGIKYSKDCADNVFLYTSRNAFMLIVRNLISNAVKFTERGGSIWISVRQDTPEAPVRLDVIDSGVGMEPDMIVRLFSNDRSVHRAGTERETGTGVGLRVAYAMAQRLGGDISVKSDKGKGSTFTLVLPEFKPEEEKNLWKKKSH